MEPNTTTPDQGGESHPFFISKPVFRYRVSYAHISEIKHIEYRSPLEVILNLRSFQDTDTVTYINMDSGKNAFALNVDRFKVMVAQTVVNSSVDDVDSLYLRLLLVNHYSPSISDRGYLKEMDRQLRRYLAKTTRGIDRHIYGGILYLKYRRMSVSHLRAVILEYKQNHDVQFYNINTPSSIPNRWLFRELIRLSIPDNIIRMHTYNQRSEDNMIDTPIPGIPDKIIRIINTLIK